MNWKKKLVGLFTMLLMLSSLLLVVMMTKVKKQIRKLKKKRTRKLLLKKRQKLKISIMTKLHTAEVPDDKLLKLVAEAGRC